MSSSKSPWSVPNKVGFVIAILLGLINLPSVFIPTDPDVVGPPVDINVADTVLSAIVIAAIVIAWVLRSRVAARIGAGAIILLVLTALPGLFVDIEPIIKVSVAAFTVASVIACVLILRPSKQPAVAATP